ncbi:putative fasciclin-like arabinogalactan protein 20 [Tasmannia lanceolata]|uniref:putative fasciclin-like arabinogalactan protein 20 n=1 Tax=Tasmannia lanceolata TaxID=3420 RepID=UPI004064601E
MAVYLLLSLLLFSLFSTFYFLSSSSQTALNALEILSNSSFTSMALTLQLITSQTLIPDSSSATIFSPSDDAFIISGQPSLILLQYHFSPMKFTPQDLRSFTFGTKIPTFYQNHSLIVTNSGSDGEISLNNVKINESIIYDDGSVIIYGIDRFFDPSFESTEISSRSDLWPCKPPLLYDRSDFSGDSFYRASELLKSRGYSVIASYLDLQLVELQDQTKLTIFAPLDDFLTQHWDNFSEYLSFFRRHVLPCKLKWTDLVLLKDGTELQTLSKVNVSRSGDILVLNGIPVIFPDMYYGELLVVHGLRQVLTKQVDPDQDENSFEEDYAEFEGY